VQRIAFYERSIQVDTKWYVHSLGWSVYRLKFYWQDHRLRLWLDYKFASVLRNLLRGSSVF